MEVRKPGVIYGLESCFALRFEIVFIGACLLTNLLNLLKRREQIIHIARFPFNNSIPVHLGKFGIETISRKL